MSLEAKKKMHLLQKVNKVALNGDDDKRIQSLEDLICNKKKETKCNNIIKQFKKWLTLTML